MKKMPGDIIILYKCTMNENHMMYCSWDMKHDRQNFLSFWTVFCLFTSLTTQKIKILKIWKKQTNPGDIIILHKRTKNHDHVLQCSLDIAHNGCNYFSSWAKFCPFTSLTTWKIKIKKKKNEKRPGDIIILHMCTKNYDQMMYSSWDMVRNRQKDGWTEKVTYRGGCPT